MAESFVCPGCGEPLTWSDLMGDWRHPSYEAARACLKLRYPDTLRWFEQRHGGAPDA